MLDYAGLRTHARNLVRDSDTVIDNTTFESLANDVYNWWLEQKRDRIQVLPGSDTGLSTLANNFSTPTTSNTIQRLLTVHRETVDTGTFGAALRYVDPLKLYWMRRRSTTSGVPKYVTWWREAGTGGDWRVLVHPPADQTYFYSALAELQAVDLTADSDRADVTAGEQYVLARLIAYEMGMLLDRSDHFLDSMLAPLDDELRTAFRVASALEFPRAPQGAGAI